MLVRDTQGKTRGWDRRESLVRWYLMQPISIALVGTSWSGTRPVKLRSCRHRRVFFLPGGAQENAETAEQAAIREAYEECGLRIRLTSRLGAPDEFVFAEDEAVYYRKRCAFFGAAAVRQEGQSEADHELI